MKTPRPHSTRGFTLIEMIGVLAIMSIMAAVIVPRVFKSIEDASIKAEGDSLNNLGEAVKLYLRKNFVLPGTNVSPATASWSDDLSGFTDLDPNAILINKRLQTRVFVIEPLLTPPRRALLISSTLVGQPVPTATELGTPALFNTVWQTAEGLAPVGAPWTTYGWSAANAKYLMIQRINLQATNTLNASDTQSFNVVLNNRVIGQTVSYRLRSALTGVTTSGKVLPAPAPDTTPAVPTVHPKDTLELFRDSTWSTLDYTYIFGSGNTNSLTFDFTDTVPPTIPQWIAK
jgi:prepilin-type N-terminal cleavage/methylation domain-containing protein